MRTDQFVATAGTLVLPPGGETTGASRPWKTPATDAAAPGSVTTCATPDLKQRGRPFNDGRRYPNCVSNSTLLEALASDQLSKRIRLASVRLIDRLHKHGLVRHEDAGPFTTGDKLL